MNTYFQGQITKRITGNDKDHVTHAPADCVNTFRRFYELFKLNENKTFI